MKKFSEYLKEKGFVLSPWQESLARGVLKMMAPHQGHSAGKTWILELLLDFVNRHGNNFEVDLPEKPTYRAALEQCICVLRQWHGPEAFEIYYDRSPEMALVRAKLPGYRVLPETNYRTAQNVIEEFVKECCRLDPCARVRVDRLFGSFVQWFKGNISEKVMSRTRFMREMRNRFEQVKAGGMVYLVGLRLMDRKCRVCGCTDDDCRQCIEAQGFPCEWVEEDLCSRCAAREHNALPEAK